MDADDWEPPKWGRPQATPADLDDDDRRAGRRAPRQPRRRAAGAVRDGAFVGLAVAPLATAALSWLVSLSPRLYGTGDLPRGMIAVVVVQAVVVGLMVQGEGSPLVPTWVATLFATSVMLPVLALQVSLLHEPFVALANDSAGPALTATALVLALLGGYGLWCGRTLGERPELAAVAFMPPALAVPSMIGHAGTVTQLDGLRTLIEIGLMAGVATLAVWAFPGWPQAMVGAIGLALELMVLLATGRGPWREATAGAVVPAVYIVMLVVTSLLVVFVPVTPMVRRPRRRSGL